MFCPECGKENEPAAQFCGWCGTALFEESQKKKINIKIGDIIRGLLAVVIVVTGVCVFNRLGKSDETSNIKIANHATENSVGNSAGNIANGGYVAGQGDWNYYWYANCLMKIDSKGNINKLLSLPNIDAHVYSLNLMGDWLYYGCDDYLYKVRTDGTENQLIVENIIGNFFMTDSQIYFVKRNQVSASAFEYEVDSYAIKGGTTSTLITGLTTDSKIVGLYGKDLLPVVEVSDGQFGKIENGELIYFSVGEGYDYFFIEGARLFGIKETYNEVYKFQAGEITVYSLQDNQEEKHCVYDGYLFGLNAIADKVILATAGKVSDPDEGIVIEFKTN